MKKVTIKVGMLATELGYRDGSNHWVFKSENGSLYGTNARYGISGKEKTFKQPTQSELQTWLRKKGIEVYVVPEYYREDVVGYNPLVKWIGDYAFHTKKTYEKAMEDGLFLALKHLKKSKKK